MTVPDNSKRKGRPWLPFSLLLLLVAALPAETILEFAVSGDGEIAFIPYGLALLSLRIVACLGALLLAVLRPGRIVLIKLGMASGSVLICLVMGEMVLRLVYSPDGFECGWRSNMPALELNELGFRGHPIDYSDEDYVIVLLGDSQVEALACAYGWMPERRLEHHLGNIDPARRFRVFTLGTGGYGQDQQLLILQEYFTRYRADLVLLWQTFANDVWNNIFPTHWPANGTPKPTFRLQEGKLVGPNMPLGELMQVQSSCRLVDLVSNAILRRDKLDDEWEAFLPEAYQPLEGYAGPVNTNWQHNWNRDLATTRQENLETEKSHLAFSLTPRSDRMQYGLDLMRALFREIERLAEARSGEFFLFRVTPATPESASGSEVYGLNGRFYRVSAAQARENREYAWAGFKSVTVPITLKDHRVGPTDAHLNEHAVDQVMRDLARKLARLIADESPPTATP